MKPSNQQIKNRTSGSAQLNKKNKQWFSAAKQSLKVLSCLLLSSIIFFSCSKKDEVKKTTYTITFNTNEGSAIANATINYGEKITKPTEPTRANFTFSGWYADAALNTAFDFNTAIINNITIYAKWSINTFTITFNTNSGSAIASSTINSGEKITKPTDPTRANYSFAGWYSDASLYTAFDFNTAIINNTTLYAKWSINTFTIIFNTNSGSAIENATINYGEKITKPTDPTRANYSFAGWYSDASLNTAFDFATSITANTTLYAKWSINTFTIIFNTNSGSAIASSTINSGEKITKPTEPTRANYSFAGWYSDAALTTAFDFNTAIINNTTLYAKWGCSITFETNGGSAVDIQIVEIGGKATRPTAPTQTGKQFLDWYADAAFTTLFDFSTDPNSAIINQNTKIYAKWITATTITVSADGTLNQMLGVSGAVDIPERVNGVKIVKVQNTIGATTIFVNKRFDPNNTVTSVTFPLSITSIGAYAFIECRGLTGTLTLPNSITNIEGAAFQNCVGLTSITLPNTLTTISLYTFFNCSGLTSITLPNSITTIDDAAFSYCSSLTALTLPNSVSTIGETAFLGCTTLTITVSSSTPATLGSDVFGLGTSQVVGIKVPTANLATYKAATGWVDYKDIITGY